MIVYLKRHFFTKISLEPGKVTEEKFGKIDVRIFDGSIQFGNIFIFVYIYFKECSFYD